MWNCKMFYSVLLWAMFFATSAIFAKPMEVNYQVFTLNPASHYFEVEIDIKANGQKKLELEMPVWTPGSYLVREYAKNVDQVFAFSTDGQKLTVSKSAKNIWQITNPTGQTVKVKYRVYAFELSVRTNYLESRFGLITPAALVMRPKQTETFGYIEVDAAPFKKVACPLDVVNSTSTKKRYSYTNFDELIDSPILIGNFEEILFTAANIPHNLIILGNPPCQPPNLTERIAKIIEKQVEFFGSHPCKNYNIFSLFEEGQYGGLEHKNSTVLLNDLYTFCQKSETEKYLGLVSHEYFHLWNGKRIRPIELGPFDYSNENYTSLLWQTEGFTSYFDDLFLLRAQLITFEQYLGIIEANYNLVHTYNGHLVQSVAESSYDAWIKFYRNNENTSNSQVSYYQKGMLLALALDLTIIKQTNGKKNLGDVLRKQFEMYKQNPNVGFTQAHLLAIVEEVGGKSCSEFLSKYANSTDLLPIGELLGYVGVTLSPLGPKIGTLGKFGFEATDRNGGVYITKVMAGAFAEQIGLQVDDEIVAVNGHRVRKTTDFTRLFAAYPDSAFEFVSARKSVMMQLKGKPKKSGYATQFTVGKPTLKNEELRQAWLYKNR